MRPALPQHASFRAPANGPEKRCGHRPFPKELWLAGLFIIVGRVRLNNGDFNASAIAMVLRHKQKENLLVIKERNNLVE